MNKKKEKDSKYTPFMLEEYLLTCPSIVEGIYIYIYIYIYIILLPH
jgi:hypothetical protein